MTAGKILPLLIKGLFSRKARDRIRALLEERWIERCRIIMTLVVRNEAAILEKSIRYHKAMGVSGFIVSTHNSTDETNAILERLKAEGLVLEIIYRTGPSHHHAEWVQEMIDLARRKYGAQWMINIDADEFYYSKCHDLRRSILKDARSGANVLRVESTFLFPDDRPDFLTCPYFVTSLLSRWKADKLGVTDKPEFWELIAGNNICPKVIHRASGRPRIENGNHDVEIRHKKSVEASDIRMYHYMVPNYRGYEAKVIRWQVAAALMPDGMGAHVKKMIALYEKGELRADYERRYGADMLKLLIDNGVVTRDFSVADFFEEKGIAAV